MILKHCFQLNIDKNYMIFNKNTLIKTRKCNVNTKKKIDKKSIY